MVKTNCYKCINRRDVSGNTHIKCVNPDPEMTGNTHGINRGWFIYPILFDPVWMTKECCNFEAKNEESKVNHAVSGVVSNLL